MSLFSELKRRNVFRVAVAYLALAWLLTEVAGTLFPVFGIPDWGVRFVVVLFVLGFGPVLVFSWIYELTPDGLRRERDVVREASITHLTAKRLDLFTIALIVVALVFVAGDRLWRATWLEGQPTVPPKTLADREPTTKTSTGEAAYPENSIAVLPFVNMSDDAANQYFADGVSEELLNLLAQIPDLRVIARTSSFAYKGKDATIPDIARELNVGHVLEGSVRKTGNKVRITAQLIRGDDSSHEWSATYDRTLVNIFAIQDEIASAVVKQLKVALLGPAPSVQEFDPDAYALYLKALYLARQDTLEAIEESNALFQEVLEIAPDFAAAWNGLAANYRVQTRAGRRPYDVGYGLVRDAANKALAIDQTYAPAYANLGWFAMDFDGDLEAAAQLLQRALELEPTNLSIVADAAILARNLGRLKEASALLEYALDRDPANPAGYGRLGIIYYLAGNLDKAIASSRTALTLSPGLTRAHYQICEALLMKGDAEAALEVIHEEPQSGYRLFGLALSLYALGRVEDSDAALRELIEGYEQFAAYNIAYIFAFRGEADLAFEWLRKAVQYRDPGLSHIMINPLFANIHDDPRWQPFLESIGKSPEQLKAIEFKVKVPSLSG
jgi:TolB-like protein/Flp pilus assembly protein TadD